MKKVLFWLTPIILACLVFFGFMFYWGHLPSDGGLQVTSVPKSKVYLNDKLIGTTPLCKCEKPNTLPGGDYTLRLVPVDNSLNLFPFEEKITINKAVLTVVDQTFGAQAQGSTITLLPLDNKNQTQIMVTSFPDQVNVSLDSGSATQTPTLLNNVTDSNHELALSKSGYQTKILPIRAVLGYQLNVIAALAIDLNPATSSAIGSGSAQLTQAASSSGSMATAAQVLILNTPTGFLRVRDSGSLSGAEIAQVNSGDKFDLVSETNSWFQIKLNDGKLGWVSKTYAKQE